MIKYSVEQVLQREALQTAISSLERYILFAFNSELAVPGEVDSIRADLITLYKEEYSK